MKMQGNNNWNRATLAILAAATVFTSAGCKSDDPSVAFNDTDTLPSLPANTVPSHKLANLSREDEMAVEEQVYSNLLSGHYWDDASYGAIFLSASDSEVQTLRDKFPNHVPPIKPSNRVDLRPGSPPLDKDTGKPALIVSVDLSEPVPDGSVSAIGKWYAGEATTGFYSFILRKNGNNWEIRNLP